MLSSRKQSADNNSILQGLKSESQLRSKTSPTHGSSNLDALLKRTEHELQNLDLLTDFNSTQASGNNFDESFIDILSSSSYSAP